MRFLIPGLLLMTLTSPPPEAAPEETGADRVLTDFRPADDGFGWYVVNDNVMGGRSEGGFEIDGGELRFSGRTNTNGGGFSSIRANTGGLDLSAFDGIRLRVMGDGRRYTWRLATNARWRGSEIGYWADFETTDGEWRVVDLPFSSFIPRFRGRQLDGPDLDRARIAGLGLMIYDNRDGPFELRLASVQAYATGAEFTLEQYRWKSRLLVASAPSEADTELRTLRQELASTADEFAERDLVLVTLLGDGTSTAGERVLTAAEVAKARETLGLAPDTFALRLIGKDGTVKLSADSATAVSEIYGLVDRMPMRRREMADP